MWNRRQLRGTIQNDILKEYIARGTYIFPPAPSMRLITDIFRYCQAEVPHWNTISISGYHIREAGSTAAQEVAFTLANGIAYVQAAIDAGLDVDSFAGQLSFFFNAHNNFLEEVAKFRAARRMWAQIMRERFKAQKPASWMLRFHTQTAGSTLTAQQPENNVVRVALQALAAVMGGTQSLHTNSMDEALWLPTEKAVRVALRTQQIIAHESGVADTIDPLAGSYLVEYLTDEIERMAYRIPSRRIDDMGGALAAIEHGYIQDEIQDAAYAYQQARGAQRRDGGGRQRLPGGREGGAGAAEGRPGDRAGPARPPGGAAPAPGCRTAPHELLAQPGERRPRQRKPDAAVDRLRRERPDPGRDLRRAARPVGRIPAPGLDIKEQGMTKVLRIDHIAVLVDDLEKTLAFWRDGLGMELDARGGCPGGEVHGGFFARGRQRGRAGQTHHG